MHVLSNFLAEISSKPGISDAVYALDFFQMWPLIMELFRYRSRDIYIVNLQCRLNHICPLKNKCSDRVVLPS